MSLKLRRNYPKILLLLLVLCVLALGMGDQQIVAYTITVEPGQTAQFATILAALAHQAARLAGLSII